MAAPVTGFLNEAAARSVDSTVTYRKQQGVPRESLRLCETKRRIKRQPAYQCLGMRRPSRPLHESRQGKHKQRDTSQRVGGNADYRQKAVSRRHSRREVSWKDPASCGAVESRKGEWPDWAVKR